MEQTVAMEVQCVSSFLLYNYNSLSSPNKPYQPMWDSALTRLQLLLRGIKFLPSDCKDELQSVCHKVSFEPRDVKYSDQSEI